MNGGDFPERTPPRAVGSENKILVVISDVFRSGVGWPATKIGVVNLEELFRHGGRSGHHDVHDAQFEVHQWAVCAGQVRDGVVRHWAQVWHVSYNGPRFWAWREWERRARRELDEAVYEDRCSEGGEAN